MADYTPVPIGDESGIELAGQIKIIDLSMILADSQEIPLHAFFTEIDIFEDLYSPYMTGKIIITDSYNLLSSLPILGEERLRLKFSTPNLKEVVKEFFIVSLDSHVLSSDKKHTYVLQFTSDKVYLDTTTKLSRAYSGTGAEIIRSIFKESLKVKDDDKLVIEETFNKFKFVSPFWSPFQCIAYATSRSENNKHTTDFMFFETMNFHKLASMSTLMSSNAVTDIYFDKRSMRVKGSDGSSVRDLDLQYKMAKKFDYISSFDTIRQLQQGTLSNLVVGFDLLNKNIKYNHYDYMRDFDKSTHLEKHPVHTRNMVLGSPGIIKSKVTARATHDGYSTDNTDKVTSTRIAMLGQLELNKLDVTLPGRTDLSVGMVLNFAMPNFKNINKTDAANSDNLDPYYSGKYLITAIRHRMTLTRHEMVMQIIKDSFASEIKFGVEI